MLNKYIVLFSPKNQFSHRGSGMVIKSHSQNFQFSFQFTRLVLGVQVMKGGIKKGFNMRYQRPKFALKHGSFKINVTLLRCSKI